MISNDENPGALAGATGAQNGITVQGDLQAQDTPKDCSEAILPDCRRYCSTDPASAGTLQVRLTACSVQPLKTKGASLVINLHAGGQP